MNVQWAKLPPTAIKTEPKLVVTPLKKSETASRCDNKELDQDVDNNICNTRALYYESSCDCKRNKFWLLCNLCGKPVFIGNCITKAKTWCHTICPTKEDVQAKKDRDLFQLDIDKDHEINRAIDNQTD